MVSICYGLCMTFKNLGSLLSKNKNVGCFIDGPHSRFQNVFVINSADLTRLQAL